MGLRHSVQGGEDAEDALSCRSLFAKEPLIIGLFCGKQPMTMRHLTRLPLLHLIYSFTFILLCLPNLIHIPNLIHKEWIYLIEYTSDLI